MKYFSELIVIYNDGITADKKSIYECTDPDDAIRRAHASMGSYMGGEGVASVAVRAFNSIEGEYAKRHWVAPAPQPEPESQTEPEVAVDEEESAY